ncbi:MAG: hypothetical protein H6Q14_1777 [Bacteroidetes bacterium]|nr:hypothetical protein [Bacteroidota bacterium]
MKSIKSKICIQASPADVWNVLVDFKRYPQWNPFILSLTGTVAENQKIEARIKPVDGSAMTFKPTVLRFVEHRTICWEGHLFFKGLFDGRHSFELLENGDGTTTFIQSETFSGILVPLFSDTIENKTLKGFHLMNQKLKEQVERNSDNLHNQITTPRS